MNSQGIGTRSHKSMQNKNSKNLSLQIGDSPTRNKLIIVEPKPNNSISNGESCGGSGNAFAVPPLTKRASEAQIYSLPPKLKSTRSTPCTPQLATTGCSSGFNSAVSPTSSASSSSPFNKPQLPTINTKVLCRPRASTIAAGTAMTLGAQSQSQGQRQGQAQVQTPSNEFIENMSRYWVFQENTPMSSNNYEPDAKDRTNINAVLSDDELDSYSESYKENCYPSGPLLVIPPYIYLYSEPSLKEVLDFDLIINVAKEITNYKEQLPAEKQVNYYHLTWSHTSQITKNLPQLTELIHNAYVNHKKVLIHCQCGVSRSASLIVAYMMRYDNLSLNDAYNKLKLIAKEISPNMSLLFQLMEWEDWLKNHDPINRTCRKQSFESISELGELTL